MKNANGDPENDDDEIAEPELVVKKVKPVKEEIESHEPPTNVIVAAVTDAVNKAFGTKLSEHETKVDARLNSFEARLPKQTKEEDHGIRSSSSEETTRTQEAGETAGAGKVTKKTKKLKLWRTL